MLYFQDQMSATRSLPDANSQKNDIARNCAGQRRSPTATQKPRIQTIWLANLFASLPQYPHLIHKFTTNCADSQASTITFLQRRISLWSYFFKVDKKRLAWHITTKNNSIYVSKVDGPEYRPPVFRIEIIQAQYSNDYSQPALGAGSKRPACIPQHVIAHRNI